MVRCVLLNADYSFLNIVDWKRAMRLIWKNKVEVLSYADQRIHGVEGFSIQVPAVMKLVKLIRTIYRSRVPFSKNNILIRDEFTCAYCGKKSPGLTVDHIIPKSRGGAASFENCAASCKPCNNKKGSRTPREAGMALRVRPYQPTISEFLRKKLMKLGVNELLKNLGLL